MGVECAYRALRVALVVERHVEHTSRERQTLAIGGLVGDLGECERASREVALERDDVIGRSPGFVFSQIADPPTVDGLDFRSAMMRLAVPSFDTELKTASGHHIPVSFSTSFLRDENDKVIGVLGIARSIRERKALE